MTVNPRDVKSFLRRLRLLCVIVTVVALPAMATAQSSTVSTEYIYLGGRLVAINPITSDRPGTPANLVATASAVNQVGLTWNASSGASRYRIERSAGDDVYVDVGTSTTASFTDTSATPGVSYLYRVYAEDSSGVPSFYSNIDLATTIIFTDALDVGVAIRIYHFTELWTAVNAVRTLAGLGTVGLDASIAVGQPIQAAHVTELRANLSAALAALGFPAPAFSHTPLTPGVTWISALDLTELRDKVK